MSLSHFPKPILALILVLLAGAVSAPTARAQAERSPFEAGINYNYVRANGPPGSCQCFSMNGGNIWAGVRLFDGFSAVGEFSGQFTNDANGTGEDLTLYSYLFGPRYTVGKSDRWQPFAQVLLGGAHASGTFEPGLTGGSGSFNSFAMVAGGGLDVTLTNHIGLRAGEIDYYLTRFPNGVNGRQNNLRVAAGLIFRF